MAKIPYELISVLCRGAVFAGFMLLRSTFRLVQMAIWFINGTAQKVKNAKNSENYESCVQVLDIQLFYSFDPMILWSRRNYIFTHNRFENPRYIIENDHVTLIAIDNEYAIFGEARERGMQLWKTEYSGFVRLAQFEYCDKLLLVPLEHFHRMTGELETIDTERIVFLFNTARCGSTLMVQVMENTGQCVSISEPVSLNDLGEKLANSVSNEQLSKLCRDVVLWICRPVTNIKLLLYFIKVNVLCSQIFPLVHEAFPRSKYLFMYRNPIDVSQSFYKFSHEVPVSVLWFSLAKISNSLGRKFLDLINLKEDFEDDDATWDDMVPGIILFLRAVKVFQESRRKGLPMSAIRYEDLVNHPRHSISRIFEYCDLPKSLVDSALHGMRSDAQRNTPFSIEKLKRYKVPEISPKLKRYMNGLFRKYGLPLYEEGEDFILDKTITLYSD